MGTGVSPPKSLFLVFFVAKKVKFGFQCLEKIEWKVPRFGKRK
jgi:hypothetical protein